jgi:hypothetical protein
MAGLQKNHPSGSTYRVVGIRGDGTREVRASNLLKATAEALKALMESWSEYERVVVEPQPPTKDRPSG